MNRKTEFKWFTISQWEQEEQYLREMHKNGWELNSITFPGIYHFKKCSSEDMVYRLDYNVNYKKEETTYIQLFEDCGWKYVMNFGGYSYFRKKANENGKSEDGEIFGDDESKIDMCKRVICGRLIPLFVILCLSVIPQLMVKYMEMSEKNDYARVFSLIFSILSAMYVVIFISFTYHYIRIRNHINNK